MLMRTAAAAVVLTVLAITAPGVARADELCKPGHVLDSGRNVCYDPATAYRPNVPAQQPVFGGSAEARPQGQPAPAQTSESSGGMFGWLKDQARFCRFGDRQVGSGDAAYCVDRNGRSYPAGK